MSDLSQTDIDRVKFVFSVYENPKDNSIDAIDIGNCLRALNLNPSLALIEKLGGTKKRGEKTLKVNDFLPLFSEAKKDTNCGVYEDFIECLKLYDKAENGFVLAAEVTHLLLNLGEKLTEKECDELCKDCMDPEDDDGNIPYVPFLARMCEREVPKNIVPQ